MEFRPVGTRLDQIRGCFENILSPRRPKLRLASATHVHRIRYRRRKFIHVPPNHFKDRKEIFLQNSARCLLRGCSRRRPVDQETQEAPGSKPPAEAGSSSAESAASLRLTYCCQPVPTAEGNGEERGDSVTKRSRSWSFLARNVGIAQAGKSCPDVPETRS